MTLNCYKFKFSRYFALLHITQPSILFGSVNEYRLWLGRFKADMCDTAWRMPCTWAPLQWPFLLRVRYNKRLTFTFTQPYVFLSDLISDTLDFVSSFITSQLLTFSWAKSHCANVLCAFYEQASWHVQTMLYNLCMHINRVGSQTIPCLLYTSPSPRD